MHAEQGDSAVRSKVRLAIPIGVIVFLLVSVVPQVSYSQSSSNCPASAMQPALQLSSSVNQLDLPPINSNSSDLQIASAINKIIPVLNSQFNIHVPLLNLATLAGGNAAKLARLVGPYNSFVSSAHAVDQNNPDSACAFLESAFILAGYSIIVGTGGVGGLAEFTVLAKVCGCDCLNAVVGSIGSFITSYYPNLQSSWSGVKGTIQGVCSSCALAVSVSGSSLASTAKSLRQFRENVVMTTYLGRQFMTAFNAFYYSWSPSLAGSIRNSTVDRTAVRYFAFPLLMILTGSESVYGIFGGSPELGVLIAGLFASALIGIVYMGIPVMLVMRKKRPKARGALPWAGIAALSSLMSVVVGSTGRVPPLVEVGLVFMVCSVVIAAPFALYRVGQIGAPTCLKFLRGTEISNGLWQRHRRDPLLRVARGSTGSE
jgi:hypothetical protein